MFFLIEINGDRKYMIESFLYKNNFKNLII